MVFLVSILQNNGTIVHISRTQHYSMSLKYLQAFQYVEGTNAKKCSLKIYSTPIATSIDIFARDASRYGSVNRSYAASEPTDTILYFMKRRSCRLSSVGYLANRQNLSITIHF